MVGHGPMCKSVFVIYFNYNIIIVVVFCILQDDKDLVPEFVVSEGLSCFIKVGAEADHNYQNYILRGLS